LRPEQERRREVDLNVHERLRDTLRTQKAGAKKWPLRGAAKFREETPRKGGGFAIEDRNTALQQYADKSLRLQAQNSKKIRYFWRKQWEFQPVFAAGWRFLRHLCSAAKP
jgi:hypothetical protein